MKTTSFIIFMMLSGLFYLPCQSQTTPPTKIGYANVEYIFSKMPEAKKIETELKSLEDQLTNQIKLKEGELKKKYEQFLQGGDMLEPVRANLEREIDMQQKNLEQLKKDAQTSFQNKQAQLIDPVYKKLGTAINDVAKENGYTIILNPVLGSQNLILYADEKVDISNLVLKKLGITVADTPSVK